MRQLSKRILSLTGNRIPDYQLNATRTLADLFSSLLAISKPKATKVVQKLMESDNAIKLTKLPNVNFRTKTIGPAEKEKRMGRWKVIKYALTERELPVNNRDRPGRQILKEKKKLAVATIGLT